MMSAQSSPCGTASAQRGSRPGQLVEEEHAPVRECSEMSLDGWGPYLAESARRPECLGIRSGSFWPVPKLRSLGAIIRGRG
jgi:hypothetical protein